VPGDAPMKRTPVLDPLERASEVVFGVLMAVSFTGSLSVATAGREEIRTMMLTALGCNLAWGLTDAVMYLIGTATERHRKAALLQRIQAAPDVGEAHRLIADALPERLAAGAGEDTLEALRKRLVTVSADSAGLGTDDYIGALGVFALVVLATFPVVIPFMFIQETALALRVSNFLALVTLFIGGWVLGRHASGRP
jgi:VIT1/CCC1 family predicted Fe2+/Mn2+ transporter